MTGTVRVTVPLPMLAVGQVWRHRRESWRRVEVTGVGQGHYAGYVYVTRNTSRRRQAILERTLRRDYYLAIVDARVARS